MNLEFSPKAMQDLCGILNCISRDKPQAAIRFVDQLEERCRLLARFQNMGAARHDLMPSLRLSSYRGYGIYFRVLSETLRIERVLSPGLSVSDEMF